MRLGIVDLGTNTFNLLVVEVGKNNKVQILNSSKVSVKLGEGGIEKNHIAELPFKRGLAAISTHLNTIREHKAENIYAFATSAIRGATNGVEFVQAVKKNFNIDIQIISGEKEAELIYYGVRQGIDLSKNKSLIMDIGGGSTEFIIADHEKLYWKGSFNIGVARLLEKFKPSDPISKDDLKIVYDYLNTQLQPLLTALNEHNPSDLVGSSGSFDSFAEMISMQEEVELDWNKTTAYTFKYEEFCAIHEQLLASDKKARSCMPGLIEMRIDMIVLASISVKFILEKHSFQTIRMSTYALKMGALWEVITNLNNKSSHE